MFVKTSTVTYKSGSTINLSLTNTSLQNTTTSYLILDKSKYNYGKICQSKLSSNLLHIVPFTIINGMLLVSTCGRYVHIFVFYFLKYRNGELSIVQKTISFKNKKIHKINFIALFKFELIFICFGNSKPINKTLT